MLVDRRLVRGLFVLLAAVAAHRPTPAADAGAPRPLNVLMIVVDDLRPELGCYGNRIVKTPNIDRLAARGVVFGRAYCQQAVCSPSRTSLMTGRRPDATRVWDLKTHFRTALPDCVTLPQHFKAHGYHTAALGKVYHRGYEDGRSWSEPHWYPSGRIVDADPDDSARRRVTRSGDGVEEYAADTPRTARGKGPATEVSRKSDEELPDGFTAAEAARRIAALAAEPTPFFLAVGFLKPHLPFVAPEKYWNLYDPAEIPGPATDRLPEGAPPFAGHTNGELHQYRDIPPGNPLPADVARRLRHGYYACISYTDAQVGRLLDAVDAAGVADRTVVVLWGDHGWQLGDHGLWHKHTNFELATRAPLIISAPACAAGGMASAPVEFVDVYPTLVDACGLPPAADLAGTSLVPMLRDPTASVKEVAVSQYPRGRGEDSAVPLMGYSIRDDRWRFTAWREDGGSRLVATELYDERDDPHETRNLAGDPRFKPVIDRLSGHLPEPGRAAKPVATRPYHAARPGSIAEAKRRLAAGDAGVRAAVDTLVDEADVLLAVRPPAVTDKRRPAASGDPHDDASLAPYYSPDRSTPDGLPSVRRNGRRNPEADDERSTDRDRADLLDAALETLGRGTGIIEGRDLAGAIDAVALIEDAGVLSREDRAALAAWAGGCLDWLLESDPGRRQQPRHLLRRARDAAGPGDQPPRGR